MFIEPLYTQKKIKFPKKTFSLVSPGEKWIDIDSKQDFELLNLYLKDPKTKKILVIFCDLMVSLNDFF